MTDTATEIVDGQTPDANEGNTTIDYGTSENSELAHGPEGSQEEIKELSAEERQNDLEKKLAEQSFNTRRERRKREQAQAELAAFKNQQNQQVSERPHVPDVPDQYDEAYSEKMRARDEAVRNAERHDYEAEYANQQQQNAYRAEKAAMVAAGDKMAEDFGEKGRKLGLSADEIQHHGARMQEAQVLTAQDASFILTDDQGPLITKYLSENLAALETLASLPPGSSARMSYLLNDVKAKATKLKAKTTSTPDPISQVEGGNGSPREKYPGTAGMIFE